MEYDLFLLFQFFILKDLMFKSVLYVACCLFAIVREMSQQFFSKEEKMFLHDWLIDWLISNLFILFSVVLLLVTPPVKSYPTVWFKLHFKWATIKLYDTECHIFLEIHKPADGIIEEMQPVFLEDSVRIFSRGKQHLLFRSSSSSDLLFSALNLFLKISWRGVLKDWRLLLKTGHATHSL